MSIVHKIINQCRKPSGWLGRLNLWDMNRRHSKLTDWGLSHIAIMETDTILDVGCGGGRTVHKLAAFATRGKIYGIDHSEDSVATAVRTNRRWLGTDHVEIQQGSVSRLPFSDRMFDLVTAVETHYYWPDLHADMREVLRVLKPGGNLIIIAEAYKGGKHEQRLQVTRGGHEIYELHSRAPECGGARRFVLEIRLLRRSGVRGIRQGLDLRDRQKAFLIFDQFDLAGPLVASTR